MAELDIGCSDDLYSLITDVMNMFKKYEIDTERIKKNYTELFALFEEDEDENVVDIEND